MSYYFGLYFGNTNLCLAVQREDKFEVLANAAGDRVTPAYVSFQNGEKLIGLSAKQAMIRNPANTVTHVKSMLGGYSGAVKNCKCKVIEEDGFEYEVELDGKATRYKPSEALTSLFKIMATIARSHCHETDIPVVVTVPLVFTPEQENVVRTCAVEAGFRLLRIVSEPAAAILAYEIGQDQDCSPSNCLVYRMGGTTIDVTVIRVVKGMYNVLGSVSVPDAGGNLFTQQLANFCGSEFSRQFKVDITENKRSVIKLHSASEVCKHILSSLGSAQCFAESLYDGIDLSINVSRARFESLVGSVLQFCVEPIAKALIASDLSVAQINNVVLAGGSCKIPKLQQIIGDMFPSSTLLASISPDEVIAVGAAKEAQIVQEEKIIADSNCHITILSHAICAKFTTEEKGATITLFPGDTPVPASHHQLLSFTTPVSLIELFQHTTGAGDDAKVRYLAKLLPPVPSLKDFTLSTLISPQGILEVTCCDSVSLKKKTVTVMPKND